MNIEKIKNYNTTMLAVIVTAAVAFAVIGLFAFLFFLITEVFNFFPRSYNNTDPGIASEQENTKYDQEDAEKLYIVYNFPQLIDTANQLFIIPVSHIRGDMLLQEYSRKFSLSSEKAYGSYDNYSDYDYNNKTYVNLVVYDAKTGKSEILFKQKILIGQFAPKYFEDETWIMFEAAYIDSNKDGRITFEDQSSLFIYSMTKKTIKQVRYGDKSLLEFNFIGDTKDLIVRFGIDPSKRYGNVEGIDSVAICKYNTETDQLFKINDDSMHKTLQELVNHK